METYNDIVVFNGSVKNDIERDFICKNLEQAILKMKILHKRLGLNKAYISSININKIKLQMR